MPPGDKTHKPGKSQVPRQLLGYGLQYTRMLSLLLEANTGATVSLEVFEDVGVQTESSTTASQTKSSLTANPVSNAAKQFWKTLRTWLDAIAANQLELTSTRFELYVFGDFEGEICSLFSEATSDTECETALARAQQILIADGKPLPQHVAAVLSADRETLIRLISRFRYNHGTGASAVDLRQQLSKAIIPSEFLDNVLTHAIGWVKKEVDGLIEQGKPAAITVSKFRTELTAYVRSLAFAAMLPDLAGAASSSEIEANRLKRYVRQIELILLRDARKLSAISAYLRSSVHRAEWGRLGLVHDHSLDDFEQRLSRYWQNSRTQGELIMKGQGVIERGQYLFSECMKFSPSLQGLQVPHDFAEGCFHALADELLIGWHPDFEKLTVDWK